MSFSPFFFFFQSREIVRSFSHVPCVVGAHEAEEVGVEHLLRDVKDRTISSLTTRVKEKVSSMDRLCSKLLEISKYLEAVAAGKLPVNNEILYNVQTILNSLPNQAVEEIKMAQCEQINDEQMILYMGMLTRTVTALHSLLLNKIQFREVETSENNTQNKKVDENEKVIVAK